jgi:phosphate butyryltransferase
MVNNFDQLVNEVRSAARRIIAVAVAQDLDVLEAVNRAQEEKIADAVLVGDQKKIENISQKNHISLKNFKILDVPDEHQAVQQSIQLIHDGSANLLMKGLCSTATLMSWILDKEKGLRKGRLLSHLGLFQSSNYPKLILMSDAALNIAPSLEDKIGILENAVGVAHRLGISEPKVAVIAAIEKVNPLKMPATVDAAILSKMNERGQLTGALVDGPLAVDSAFSFRSCEVKGIKTKVGGDADIAIVPNIEAGNIFYKVMSCLAGAKTAGIIVGASVPIILTSRADSDETKFLSIATAVRVA